jgi:hypothetical protein
VAAPYGNHNHLKHGMCKTRIYFIWKTMRQRCLNPNNRKYKNYGGRGIKICDAWGEFLPFYEWAIANGYREDLTIDRINVNGNYCPQNCKWSTIKQQERNKTTSRIITVDGESRTLAEWAEIKGIHIGTIFSRLKRGDSAERALRPVKSGGR